MTTKIQITNPLHYPDWDTFLLSTEESTFFHSLAWCKVLTKSYGYKPKYFLKTANNKISTLIPFMEINTSFTPKRGISLPFTDFCQPILSNDVRFEKILDSVFQYAKTANWRFIEFRGGQRYFNHSVPSSFYYEHNLDLKRSEEKLLASFRNSTKRNIKKALRENVTVKISNSYDSTKEFYRLHCITRKNHGLPPQPLSFFKKIYDYIISTQKGLVVTATYQNKIIAAAIFFHFGNKAIYKYGASEKRYQHLRANNLVMWEAAKWYVQNGFSNLSFGRTQPSNKGLLQFKRGWGTNEVPVYYYKYDITNNIYIKAPIRTNNLNKVAKKLPIRCLRLAGSLLYKHVG